MNKVLVAVAALGLAVGGAQAADPPMMVEPIVEVEEGFDWSGFYAGVHGGGVWGSVANSFTILGVTTTQPAFGISGWEVGAQVGGNAQFGKFVLGAEGRVSWIEASGNDAGLSGVTDAYSTNWSVSGLVRAGVALNRVMPYLIGGVTATNDDYSLTSVPPGTTISSNGTSIGGSIGGGIEIALGERVSIFGEYLHTFYGSDSVAFAAAPGIVAQTINFTPSIGTAKVGVNFHF